MIGRLIFWFLIIGAVYYLVTTPSAEKQDLGSKIKGYFAKDPIESPISPDGDPTIGTLLDGVTQVYWYGQPVSVHPCSLHGDCKYFCEECLCDIISGDCYKKVS